MQKEGKKGKKHKQQTNHKTEARYMKESILNSKSGGIHYLSTSRAKFYRNQFLSALLWIFFHLIFQILLSEVLISVWENHLMLL